MSRLRPNLFGRDLAIVAITLLIGSNLLPQATLAQARPSADQNRIWATRMTDLLKLTPLQQAALLAFIATSAKSAQIMAASADQIRAMSLRERLDYWSAQTAKVQSSARADAEALHNFYASLSAQQRARFDEATRLHDTHTSIAADVVSSPEVDAPDYQLPAHTDPNWLVKPTAENIGRVYPFAAAQARIPGKALLHCAVDEDGYLTDCVVSSESPAGLGFGNAALETTAYMRMQPATNYGVPARSSVNVPVAFALPDPE